MGAIDTRDHRIQQKLADYLRSETLAEANMIQNDFEYKETIYTKYIKRLLDISISLPAVIITIPVNFFIGIITIIFIGFPMFYSQERVGKDGRTFKLTKFRNMTNDVGEDGELLPPDQRMTKMGVLLRKTSMDELLNFWNILKGDMSIIGPRALPPVYNDRYSERHKMRFKVRPGLECPPISPLDHERSWNERFENDCWYVQNISFKTDCIMIIKLFEFAFNRKNARMRSNARSGSFIGYNKEGIAISNYDLDEETIIKILGSDSNNTHQ